MRVVVAGATGETGRRVVRALLDRGDTVRALSRSAASARAMLGDAIEVHEGDLRDRRSLVGLGVGCDVAIVTTGTRSYVGKNGGRAVDSEGTRHLVEALDGVGHLVHLSAFGLDRRSVYLTAFSAALNQYFRWKADAEAAVRGSGLRATIVRPVELRNRAPWGRPLLNQREPLSLLRTVSRDLVARVLVHCAGHPDAFGKTFELAEAEEAPGLDTQLAAMVDEQARPRPERTPLW